MAVLRKTGRVPPLYCLRVGRKEGKERILVSSAWGKWHLIIDRPDPERRPLL